MLFTFELVWFHVLLMHACTLCTIIYCTNPILCLPVFNLIVASSTQYYCYMEIVVRNPTSLIYRYFATHTLLFCKPQLFIV